LGKCDRLENFIKWLIVSIKINLRKKIGLSIAKIAEELEIDIALVNQFMANKNN
jgi:predicted transposase YdaD